MDITGSIPNRNLDIPTITFILCSRSGCLTQVFLIFLLSMRFAVAYVSFLLRLRFLQTTLPAIVMAQRVDFSIASSEENSCKNRYKNNLPSNDARVMLKSPSGKSRSNYINASFIDGYNHYAKFIAAQRPKRETVNDFWKMIVENRCAVIVMLGQLEEGYTVMCQKYWPEAGEQRRCGEFLVEGQKMVSYGEFCCTSFKITETSNRTTFEASHFQYFNWPDHRIPPTTSGLMRLHKAACAAQPSHAGPMLVHCSGGVGSTAVFIALDILSNQLSQTNQVNVLEAVYKMRLCRTSMVQNLDQYIYIHKLLAEIYLLGTSEMDVKEFLSLETSANVSTHQSKKNKVEIQFSLLTQIPPSMSNSSFGSTPINRAKNRDLSVLPYDHNIAFVSMASKDTEVPYINASNIQAYSAQSYFIVTQNPIPQNVELFWRCIIDNAIECVVMIDDEEASEKYWADDDATVTFNDVHVRTLNRVKCSHYLERNIEVIKKDQLKPHKVIQIVIGGWSKNSSLSTSALLEVIRILKKRSAESKEIRGKRFIALIHCRDGSDQSGTLCAIYNLIERVENEKLVDVLRAVKDVRDLRMGAVGSFEQFKLCCDVVKQYLQPTYHEVNPDCNTV